MRGRPPVTRARVLNYIEKHQPTSIMQICRATGAERSHVKRLLRMGRVMNETANMKINVDIINRFWSHVDKGCGSGPNGDCWDWTGAISTSGYPSRFFIDGCSYQASHVAMTIDGRPRQNNDMYGLHSCDNKKCVNPSHLRWGTDSENHEDHRQRYKRGLHWLPDDVVHEIHRSNESNKELALRIGVSPAAICNIRKGRSHKAIFDQYCPMTS